MVPWRLRNWSYGGAPRRRTSRSVRTLLLLPVLLAASRGAAQPAAAPAAPRDTARPTLVAAHAARHLTIDGKLDEPAWSAAEPAARFTQARPRDGAAPSERTEVRVL